LVFVISPSVFVIRHFRGILPEKSWEPLA